MAAAKLSKDQRELIGILRRWLEVEFAGKDKATNAARMAAATSAVLVGPLPAIDIVEAMIESGNNPGAEEKRLRYRLEMLLAIDETFGDSLTLDDVKTQEDVKKLLK